MTEPKPIKPEDLFRLKSITDGRLSPDGGTFCYVLSHVDAEKEEEYASLWLLDIPSGETRQLTYGKHSDSNPDWSPDGKTLAFVSSRLEKPQIFLIPVDGGEAQPLTELKQGVGGGPYWSPDGQTIAFTAAKEVETRDPKKPYRLKRNIFRFDGMGYVRDVIQDIFLIPAKGGEAKQVTDDDWNNTSPCWSPNSQELLYQANLSPDTHCLRPRLRTVDLNGTIRELLGDWGNYGEALWSTDGESIIFTGQPKGLPMGTKNDLWVVAKEGGKPICRTPGLEIGVAGDLQGDFPGTEFQGRTLLSQNGKSVYVRVQNGGALGVYQIALQGEEAWQPVLTGERLAALAGAGAEHLIYTVSAFNEPGDIYRADPDGKNERRLTRVNKSVQSGWMLPATERLVFPSADGQPIEGWIMKPVTGEAPYPTVLYIHGGPTGAFGSVFTFDFHMLAGAGYAVLFINPRGSSGYGSDFATAITAEWGGLDYKDLMVGVDHAIEMGIADPDRLGIAGLSYGGYMSCWSVGQTERFKAAVPENPVVNLVSMFGTSDISADFLVTAMGGKPHEVLEVYWKCSPITNAHKCTTPTLLIQGESDFRCPAEQAEQFYSTLKANGCVVEMLRLPGGSHIGSITGAVALRKAQNEALLDWMNRYVLGES